MCTEIVNRTVIFELFFFLDTCDRGWHHSRDILIISGFVFSLLPIILVPTVPFICTPLCCKKCEKVFTIFHYTIHNSIIHATSPLQLSMVGIMIHVITSPRSFATVFCLFVFVFFYLFVCFWNSPNSGKP